MVSCRLTSLLLVVLACCTGIQTGTPIAPSSSEWVWLAEVDDLAADWRANPALPSIDTLGITGDDLFLTSENASTLGFTSNVDFVIFYQAGA